MAYLDLEVTVVVVFLDNDSARILLADEGFDLATDDGSAARGLVERELAVRRHAELDIAKAAVEFEAVVAAVVGRLEEVNVVKAVSVRFGIFRGVPSCHDRCGQVGPAHFGLGVQPRARAVEDHFAQHTACVDKLHFGQAVVRVDLNDTGVGIMTADEIHHAAAGRRGNEPVVIRLAATVGNCLDEHAVFRVIKVHLLTGVLHLDDVKQGDALTADQVDVVHMPSGVFAGLESGLHSFGQAVKTHVVLTHQPGAVRLIEPSRPWHPTAAVGVRVREVGHGIGAPDFPLDVTRTGEQALKRALCLRRNLSGAGRASVLVVAASRRKHQADGERRYNFWVFPHSR